MSYGGLLLDLFVTFFLIFKRTRVFAFLAVVLFHLINLMVFQIGIFPWLSTTITAMYFRPDFPRRIFYWLGAKINKLQWVVDKWNAFWREVPEADSYVSSVGKKPVCIFIVTLCLIQILIPLRQHYYKGDVAWTEYGHRGSWRMMLRGKTGRGVFTVVEEGTDRKEQIRAKKFLYKRQERKMYGQPDMILEFAHFLKEKYEKEGWKNPKVYADIKVRLNGRKYARYVDKDFDLGSWEWTFGEEAEWLLEEGEEKRAD